MPTPAEEAFRATIGELATRAQYETLAAGRGVIQETAPRWRRVTDGDPCGFCAMLASRGPVYRSAGKAGDGNRYHGRCGCTVEPFDGDPDDWEPTPEEQRYIDAYRESYETGIAPGKLTEEIERRLAEQADRELSIDGLDDAAADALMARLADEGDFDGAARIGELLDERNAASKAEVAKQVRDMRQDFHPAAYEWYANLSEDGKFAYLDQYGDDQDLMQEFLQEQWSWANGGTAAKRAVIPTERQIRAEWEDYVYAESLRIENATNGTALSKKARADGRRIADLLRVNEATARSWASEETRRYWDANGRLTYEAFKAGYTGDDEAIRRSQKAYWA